MNEQDFLSPKEVGERLGISDSTLRKWCLALESNDYHFTRTELNRRVFSTNEVHILEQFKYLVKTKGMTIENASEIISNKYSGVDAFEIETESEQPKNSVPNEEIQEIKSDLQQLKELNKALLQRLDEQQNYIENRLNDRDQLLLQSIRETQETKQLLLATKEENEKKRRKGIMRFFSRDEE